MITRWRWRTCGWLVWGAVVACLATGCSQPIQVAAYRQACSAYAAAIDAIASSDSMIPWAAGSPEFELGLKYAQRSHDTALAHAFENLSQGTAKIQKVGRLRIAQNVESSIRSAVTVIVEGYEARGDHIQIKSVLHLV